MQIDVIKRVIELVSEVVPLLSRNALDAIGYKGWVTIDGNHVLIGEEDSSVGNKIMDIEKNFINRDTEYGIGFDTKGNQIFETISGNKYTVKIPLDDKEKLRGNIFTHNHPTNDTFSPDDIEVMISLGMKEIRAITEHGVYSMENNYKVKVIDYFRSARLALGDESYETVNLDNLWKSVSRDLGFRYTFKEW
jgi:hypothetical protein